MERWGPDKMRNMDSNNSKMEVTIGEDLQDNRPVIKERPIWLTESTVVENTSTRVRNSFSYFILLKLINNIIHSIFFKKQIYLLYFKF